MENVLKLSCPGAAGYWEIDILFEDRDLLALNKPAGLLTAPDSHDPDRPSLLKLLHAGIAEAKSWARHRGLNYLMVGHRPDPEVSGVLLLAKSKPVLVKLSELLGSEKPFVKYFALVQGKPVEARFEVDAKLALHPTHPQLMRVDPRHGKRSRTTFEVSEQFHGWTLLKCEPLTARTHQIRVHLKSVGLPLVGDALYGGKPLLLSRLKQGYRLKPKQVERPLIGRPALHAHELTLPHPVHDSPITITAPFAKDFEVGLKYLRRYASVSQEQLK